MKLISNRALREFARKYPHAEQPLLAWRRQIEGKSFAGFADLRAVFASVDKVGDRYVFDVGGNKFRLIVSVAFSVQVVWVKAVLTHDQYDMEKWK